MQAALTPEIPPLPFANCYWVLPGRLLAGEYPAGLTREATRERLQRLAAAGIGCCVDLTVAGELPPYQECLPAGCEHRRFPITDHGVPAERGEMAQALEFLHQALSSDRAVYLHCRAGIGRTGMVAGCLLAERGFSGEAALVELNRLWQQSGRAAHWPSVPETPAQVAYVREWQAARAGSADPFLDPQALTAARGLRERFLGALLGLAVGDAVAAATQYRRPGRFAPVGDLLGGGPFDLPRGGWSDDTAMALCVAESLIECDAFNAHDQVERYLRWQQQGHLSATGECLGITAGTSRALARARWRRQAFSGSHDPEVLDPEALSRVAPVAMYFFADAQLAEAQAAEAARTTAQAPAVLAACRTLARALHAALAGQPRAAILAQAPAPVRGATAPAVAGVSAPQALAGAIDAFARSDNFRDAVLAAANLGGNSDVIAAVCGALAGAHYTASSIPALWRNSLMKRELIEAYADRLLAHALVELGG
ncbi:MAG TPA: ADP-ribosylglycohydrolase family protein [Steroidobacteraceae bacterium]|jgi:ADP-ribosyl-[dinitrogen reductase] hydrolase|nr:ADP-ribosylglycohydrolase family protein [Steroidobacteraceae bacterium]